MSESETNQSARGTSPGGGSGVEAPRHWLLLRGLAREQRHWGRFPSQLEAATGARAHLLDLPGAGTEAAVDVPLTISGFVQQLRARWLPLRAAHPGPWGLLGISLGGMVTMRWGEEFPDDFSQLLLCNTSASDLSLPWRRMQPAILGQVVRAMAMTDERARESRIVRCVSNRSDLWESTAAEWATYALDRPMRRASVVRQVLAASRHKAPQRLQPRTVVLVGDGDRLCHPSCSEALAAHLSVPLYRHPTAGHDLSIDASDWLAERVAAL
jgi:pimeloyl-ACP methyl ester carboxylesterase